MPYQDNTGRWHETEETAKADDAARARVAATDWAAEEQKLREEAARQGLEYHSSDLEDIRRNYGYDVPTGTLEQLRANAFRKYQERATNEPGGGEDGGGGYGAGGGFPYPERVMMPDPTQPTPYASTYQNQLFQAPYAVGEQDRNRILQSILQSPETLGATQQAQLFEKQKELLNAQRQQQAAQMAQGFAARGIQGGLQTQAEEDLNRGFNTQLLQAQRDIPLKAATQNRQDQLAALEMQDALSKGDFSRMMDVYRANQQERVNTENFLREAAALTQAGTLQYNTQRLAQAGAQQGEIMDFYRFLEAQRQFQQNMLDTRFTTMTMIPRGY